MAKALRGEIEVELAGEKYTLRLSLGDLEELDNVTGLGTLALATALGSPGARLTHAVPVLTLAIQINGKRAPVSRARELIARAGFFECVEAATAIMAAVLVDPDPGNADAAAPTERPTAA